MADKRSRKVLAAPQEWSKEAVDNFNRAQLAAEKARLKGEDPDQAFKQALREAWNKPGLPPS